MTLEQLKGRLPGYAKDLKLNLSNITASTALNARQIWGAALAAAIAARNPSVTAAIASEASTVLSSEELEAAKAAAAIMAMNNVYYRSVHLLSSKEYQQMPARLRMNVIARPGADKLDFELWSLAVSAVNGCGMCLEAHEREVLTKGLTREAVQDALRIAAVVHAVAVTLEQDEAMTSPDLSAAA